MTDEPTQGAAPVELSQRLPSAPDESGAETISSGFCEVNGTRLYFLRRGSGPPLYALHGGPGLDHSTLACGMAPFEAHYSVYYIDLRGHGRSGRPPVETYTFQQLALDIEAFRQQLGHQRIVLLGHSMGGKVATVYCLEFPGAVEKLVLVSANATPPQFAFSLLLAPGRYAARAQLLRWALEDATRKVLGRPWSLEEAQRRFWGFAWQLYSRKDAPTELLRPMLQAAVHPPLIAFQPLMDQLLAVDLTSKMRHLNVRTLIVCGDEDVLFWDEQYRLFPIPRAVFSAIPNAGHFPHVDQPEAFAEVVLAFLKSTNTLTTIY